MRVYGDSISMIMLSVKTVIVMNAVNTRCLSSRRNLGIFYILTCTICAPTDKINVMKRQIHPQERRRVTY